MFGTSSKVPVPSSQLDDSGNVDNEYADENTEKKYKTIISEAELNAFLYEIRNYKEVSIDLETTDIDANKANIVVISF